VVLQLLAVTMCLIFPEIILWLPRRFGFLD
jgi:hypothetical protein